MGPQVRDEAISGSPFRKEAVLTLFERVTYWFVPAGARLPYC